MEDQEIPMHDIVIIGAGLCGLGLAARLREPTPSALFTDSEHRRYHWMRSSATSRRNTKLSRTSRRQNTAPDRLLSGPAVSARDDELDIAVLDEKGEWMKNWNSNFESLKISHLRSPHVGSEG